MHFDIVNHLFDIILAVLFVACTLTGLAKGLVEMATSAVSAVIAFIAAKIYAPRISGGIYENYVKKILISKSAEKIEELSSSGRTPLTVSLPEPVVSMAQKAGINLEAALRDVVGQGTAAESARKFVSLIEKPIVIPAIEFALFVAGAIIVYAVLRLLTVPVCALVKLPVLKEVNKTAGLILGAVKGVFIVFCFTAVSLLIASACEGTAFANAVEGSYIAAAVASIINGK